MVGYFQMNKSNKPPGGLTQNSMHIGRAEGSVLVVTFSMIIGALALP